MGIQCAECQFENPDDSVFCGKCGSKFPLSDEDAISITRTLQTPAKDLLKGETFAERYQIIQELGRGGMGVVYKAHDTKLNRRVALKFLPQELTHITELKERFMREAQAAAALDHPNICTVYEFEETEDTTFISMAFIEGENLKKKIDQGPLGLDEAIRIAIQTAEGLEEAHKKGVVHRDIKSANIMVDDRGQAKIMDFGLARMSGGTLLTQEGMAMGTIAYMSPEQARGEVVDHRTDIWSFGVVLYEMFSGQLPFKGDHEQAAVYSILNEKPKPVTEVREEIPTSLEQVIDKALEKNPEKRYQNIDDMIDDLKSISEGIVPEEIKARLRKAKLLKRKRAILYGGAASILVILTVVALSVFTGHAEAIDAIAVLPIDNLTGDAEHDYIADAATDELIGHLSQISALRVISRRSVMTYKGKEKSLPEIAKELNVDALVEGTVLQVGDSVRVRVQLIEVLPEERNLWAQTYDRKTTDVQIMYREMARAIADETRIELTAQEDATLASTHQVNPEAYEAYRKGLFHWYKLTAQDLEIARKYFELALEKDPNYALAYLGLDSVLGGYRIQGLMPPIEANEKRKVYRQKAMELNPNLPEVQFGIAGGNIWGTPNWDWEAGEKAYLRAIELNPNFAMGRAYYAYLLFYLNRPEEAMAQIERALEIDPFHANIRTVYAWCLMYAHRYDEAVEFLEETLRTDPTGQMALSGLKSAYHLTGQHEKAMEVWKTWFSSRGEHEDEEALIRGYEEGGYFSALSSVADIKVARRKTTFVSPWQIATLYTRARRNDEALDWLKIAYEERDPNFSYICVDPIFDDLRDDPRFQNLMRYLNLPQGE
jgi:TolB-like protein/tRNA A-37 threonylcarbamoyl transferase component Bud32/Tfp pilus assembly protein PilF